MQPPMLLLICAITVLVTLCVLRRKGAISGSLPPGPRGLPVLGNLHQTPSKLLFLKLVEWANEYGAIYSYSFVGQPVVVINTAKAAGDILDRLSLKTSARPRFVKLNTYLTRNMAFAFIAKNDVWRKNRRATHENMNVRAAEAFYSVQEDEATTLVEGLLAHPEIEITEHLHRLSSSIAWRTLFGHGKVELTAPNPSAPMDNFFLEFFKAAMPGNSIVDILPVLEPLISRSKLLRRQADTLYEASSAFFTKTFSDSQVEGTISLSGNLKGTADKLGMTVQDCSWLGAILYLAAQDTTATALRWWFLAMILYPETAVAARDELKAVVGDRPPTFSDRDHLPQIEAMVKELLRWRPPAPAGVSHSASETFTYGDYVIPAGTILIPNTWSICRDPLLYQDAERFDPSRFIDEKGRVKQPLPDSHEDYLAFGHGRRICPGKAFAVNSLWIAIATLMHAVDVKKGCDVQGNEVTPDAFDMVDHGTTVWPKSFPVVIVGRSVTGGAIGRA